MGKTKTKQLRKIHYPPGVPAPMAGRGLTIATTTHYEDELSEGV